VSGVASLAFTNPLPWLYGIVSKYHQKLYVIWKLFTYTWILWWMLLSSHAVPHVFIYNPRDCEWIQTKVTVEFESRVNTIFYSLWLTLIWSLLVEVWWWWWHVLMCETQRKFQRSLSLACDCLRTYTGYDWSVIRLISTTSCCFAKRSFEIILHTWKAYVS